MFVTGNGIHDRIILPEKLQQKALHLAKNVLRNFAEFTEKHLSQSLHFRSFSEAFYITLICLDRLPS